MRKSKAIKSSRVPVASSIEANRKPRQPKLRKTPPKGSAPLQPGEKKKTFKGINRESAELRNARERISAETVLAAQESGMLPHEWLLAVMRGEQINHYAYDSETQEVVEIIVLPTFSDRIECAKAAAPYFASRLGNDKPGGGGPTDPAKERGVMEVPIADSMEHWMEVAGASQAKLKKEVTK